MRNLNSLIRVATRAGKAGKAGMAGMAGKAGISYLLEGMACEMAGI